MSDSEGLPGESLLDVIGSISETIDIRYIGLRKVQGTGLDGLFENVRVPLDLDVFVNQVATVPQFHAGDFFLFSKYPTNWLRMTDMDYPEAIAYTDVTIRIVSGTHIYVYTRHWDLIASFRDKYFIDAEEKDLLSVLPFPEEIECQQTVHKS